MRVIIDRSKCIGGGNCVINAPGVFTQDETDGLVIVLNETPSSAERENLLKAIDTCPGRVISVLD